MSAFFASPELAVTLVKALYGAKNQEEYPLRMEALLNVRWRLIAWPRSLRK